MVEVISQRSENGKLFDTGKRRRRLETSTGAIHYKDDYTDHKEPWKEVDLTWEGNRITRAPYELTVDGTKLTLRDKKTGEVSTLELLSCTPAGLQWEIIPEIHKVGFRHTLLPDKVPFEARFKVSGNIPLRSRAFDDKGELPLDITLKDGILTERLSSIIREPVGKIRIDPTWSIVTGTDDVFRRLTPDFFDRGYNPIRVGTYLVTTTNKCGGGWRYTNITIPQGATISSASLYVRANDSGNAEVCNSRISAEDIDNAGVIINDAATFDARWAARTAARVDWDAIPVWAEGSYHSSPDISAVIKEVVDRGGWVSGNAMLIFWDDFENRSTDANGCYRSVYAYEGGPVYAVKLIIDFEDIQAQAAAMGHKMVAAGLI